MRHSELVLFSAAIPGQGGHHHVNEQFPDYWAELFARRGYVPLDLFRARIWQDRSILWWLRQNVLLFATEGALAGNEKLRAAGLPIGASKVPRPSKIAIADPGYAAGEDLGAALTRSARGRAGRRSSRRSSGRARRALP